MAERRSRARRRIEKAYIRSLRRQGLNEEQIIKSIADSTQTRPMSHPKYLRYISEILEDDHAELLRTTSPKFLAHEMLILKGRMEEIVKSCNDIASKSDNDMVRLSAMSLKAEAAIASMRIHVDGVEAFGLKRQVDEMEVKQKELTEENALPSNNVEPDGTIGQADYNIE
jgi:hypothetical protein